jgi:hypothetical protein
LVVSSTLSDRRLPAGQTPHDLTKSKLGGR